MRRRDGEFCACAGVMFAQLGWLKYLEVEDDGPDETQDDGWPPVHHIAGIYVHQFDLKKKKLYADRTLEKLLNEM